MGKLGGLGLRGPACLNQPTPGAHLLASDPISALGSAEPLIGCWAQGQYRDKSLAEKVPGLS